MTVDDWVKKLNTLANEMDEIAGSVHPATAMALTANLREKYRALAQSDKVTTNRTKLTGAPHNERNESDEH